MDKFLPENIIKLIKILLIVLVLLFAAKTASEFKSYKYIGGGLPQSSTISFDGQGEVFASPDIANISFSVREEAKTAKEAQAIVTKKVGLALSFLRENGVEEKDIKTTNYSSYPKYNYEQKPCTLNYCPPGKQILTGFEVSQNIEVKVRNIDDAGKIVEGLATAGVTDMNGPNFAIDKEDDLKAEARAIAIKNAKDKARELSKQLNVRLVRIVSFSEGGGSYYPMYAKAEMMSLDSAAAPTPELPIGENKITSNVSITYEIR